MAFGVFQASADDRKVATVPDGKVFYLFVKWCTLYLNHPEFSKKLDATLTKEQRELFVEVSKKTYHCYIQNLLDVKGMEKCAKKLLKNYDTKTIENLVATIHKVEGQLPARQIGDVSRKYEQIFKIYTVLVQKIGLGVKLLGEFDDKEKNFLEALVQKYNHWFFNTKDMTAFEDLAKYFIDDLNFRNIYKKVEKIAKKIPKGSAKNEESLDDLSEDVKTPKSCFYENVQKAFSFFSCIKINSS